MYRSYAFDAEPRHWDRTDWPRGLVDRIEPTQEYFDEIVTWFESTYERWAVAVRGSDPTTPVALHWGETAPLAEVVAMVSTHWAYHAGEINAILAIVRGEAWEYTEEVEENHIRTAGHGVRPAWMTDDEAARFERDR